MKSLSKKGMNLSDAPGVVLSLGLIAMIGGAVALAVQAFRDSTTANGYAYNVSQNGLSSLANLSAQTPTLGTIIGVSLIIVVVVGAFAFFAGRGNGGGL